MDTQPQDRLQPRLDEAPPPATEHLPMVGWYDPLQLLRTGVDVAVSTLLSRRDDYRLLEAFTRGDGIYEHHAGGPDDTFWFDYVADVGDGWNSTYAVAHALGQPALALAAPDGTVHDTRRGVVLVFGGDEVYPVAGRVTYRKRLVQPYADAFCPTSEPPPTAYAVAGNHDWYDGLIAFTRLFCAGRSFAGWRTQQSRSYFALRLPHGWWLLGTDVQLHSDIDAEQVAYFRRVREQMQPDDRIILCNAEPYWIYDHVYGEQHEDCSDSNLVYFEQQVLGREVSVSLAGDLHHYRRHESPDGRQKITAGGGGAFLHPTHGQDVSALKDGFAHQASFPDAATSRRLCWRNLAFLFLNPWFGAVSGLLYLLTAWSSRPDLSRFGPGEVGPALHAALLALLHQPLGFFWAAALLLGFWLFTDTHSRPYRLVGGAAHGLAHAIAVFLIGWFASASTARLGLAYGSLGQMLAAGVILFAGGWVVGASLIGGYLLISLNLFGRHSNEAFSSLGVQDWKCFLRLKITPDGALTIYPVGLRRVPRRWAPRAPGAGGPAWVPDDPHATDPKLIEAPIRVAGGH